MRRVGNLTIEDLKRDEYVPAHRNRLLAEAFYLTGDIEKYGTGFIRVREVIKDFPGTTLSINEMGDFLMVGVAATPTMTPIKTPTKKVAGLTNIEQKIFNEIKKDNTIKEPGLGKATGRNEVISPKDGTPKRAWNCVSDPETGLLTWLGARVAMRRAECLFQGFVRQTLVMKKRG